MPILELMRDEGEVRVRTCWLLANCRCSSHMECLRRIALCTAHPLGPSCDIVNGSNHVTLLFTVYSDALRRRQYARIYAKPAVQQIVALGLTRRHCVRT